MWYVGMLVGEGKFMRMCSKLSNDGLWGKDCLCVTGN